MRVIPIIRERLELRTIVPFGSGPNDASSVGYAAGNGYLIVTPHAEVDEHDIIIDTRVTVDFESDGDKPLRLAKFRVNGWQSVHAIADYLAAEIAHLDSVDEPLP